MEHKKLEKKIMIVFAVTICTLSILLVKEINSDRNINDTNKEQIITSGEYRNVEIMPNARGKITESQVDDIIEEHGTEGVKIVAVDFGSDKKVIKYWLLGVIWLFTLYGAVIWYRVRRIPASC